MAYCTQDNIESRYGVTNVEAWADLDGDDDTSKIANRIADAISVADDRIDSRLRKSDLNFRLPIAKDDGTVPILLRDISVALAGYWLSTARGVRDYDEKGNPVTRLYGDRQIALQDLEDIARGNLKLKDMP